jgi:hypothetical protein
VTQYPLTQHTTRPPCSSTTEKSGPAATAMATPELTSAGMAALDFPTSVMDATTMTFPVVLRVMMWSRPDAISTMLPPEVIDAGKNLYCWLMLLVPHQMALPDGQEAAATAAAAPVNGPPAVPMLASAAAL